MAPAGVAGQRVVVEARRSLEALGEVADSMRIPAPVGEIDPGSVRQQRVVEPEHGPAARADRVDRLLHPLGAPALDVRAEATLSRAPAAARGVGAERGVLLDHVEAIAVVPPGGETGCAGGGGSSALASGEGCGRRGSPAPPPSSRRARRSHCGTTWSAAQARRSRGSGPRRSGHRGPSASRRGTRRKRTSHVRPARRGGARRAEP